MAEKAKKKSGSNKSVKKNDGLAEVIDHQEKLKILNKHEAYIHEKTDDFIDVVIRLAEIKKDKLYEYRLDEEENQLYRGFEDYIEKEFGFRRAYYSRLNKAKKVYDEVTKDLSDQQKKGIPTYPAIYTALANIDSSQRKNAFKEIVQSKQDNTRITGTEILRWGKTNNAIKKPKYVEGAQKQVSIFEGLAKKIVADKVFTANKDLNIKNRDDLIDNLEKLLVALKKTKP